MRLWRARSSSSGGALGADAADEASRARRLASRAAEKSLSAGAAEGG
jgi:hypothetical protein